MAIVIVVIVVLFFLLRDTFSEVGFVVNPEAGGIDSFVYSCIEEVGREAVLNISVRGGYYDMPELSVDSRVPLYYVGGRNYMPINEKIEGEISKYVNDNLKKCVGDFSDFSDYDIKDGVVSTRVNIEENVTLIDVNYPLYIEKNDVVIELGDFSRFEVKVRLGAGYLAIKGFMEEQVGSEDLCLSCLVDNLVVYDLYADMYDYNESVLFVVTSNETSLEEENLKFIFANNYGGDSQ